MKKTLIRFIGLALALFIAMPMYAQKESGAFYIYQNDGHFDGFFYDDVEKISYSKLDTLNIEHEEFVSQEIVTADSTYRIMLTAIDSVGFVQPEVKFNPKLRNMEELGMTPYLTDANGMKLTFSNSLPADLQPQKGDVLVCYDFSRFEGGFGGKVRSVAKSGDGYVVECDSLTDFSDIFEQFVMLEEYAGDDAGNLAPRRAASNFRRVEGSVEMSVFSFTLTPHTPWVDSNFSATLDLNLGFSSSVKAAWNFSIFGKKQFKLEFIKRFSISAAATFSGKLEGERPFGANDLVPLYIPAAAPVFRVKCIPEGFIKAGIQATLQMQTKTFAKKLTETIEFNDWSFDADIKFETDEEDEPQSPLTITGQLAGYFHTGLKAPFVIRTNEFFAKILDAEVGLEFAIGPKFTGEVNLNVIDAVNALTSKGQKPMESTVLYDGFKDTKINFSPLHSDFSLKSHVKAIVGTDKEMELLSGSHDYINWDFYLVPEFGNLDEAPMHGRYTKLSYKVKDDRILIFTPSYGMAVYQDDGRYVTSFGAGESKKDPYYKECRAELPAGPYKFRPQMTLLGQTFPASNEKDFTMPGPYLRVRGYLDGDTATISAEKQLKNFGLSTNCVVTDAKFELGDRKTCAKVSAFDNSMVLLDIKEKGGVLPSLHTLDIEGMEQSSAQDVKTRLYLLQDASGRADSVGWGVIPNTYKLKFPLGSAGESATTTNWERCTRGRIPISLSGSDGSYQASGSVTDFKIFDTPKFYSDDSTIYKESSNYSAEISFSIQRVDSAMAAADGVLDSIGSEWDKKSYLNRLAQGRIFKISHATITSNLEETYYVHFWKKGEAVDQEHHVETVSGSYSLQDMYCDEDLSDGGERDVFSYYLSYPIYKRKDNCVSSYTITYTNSQTDEKQTVTSSDYPNDCMDAHIGLNWSGEDEGKEKD